MIKGDGARMEREALMLRTAAAVLGITHDGMAAVGHVHADLVLAPGQQVDLEQTT